MAEYCLYCERMVTAKRKIGVGTLILAIVTGGLSLLAIPLYARRCPICQGTAFGPPPRPGTR